jgi:hypothetical protein
MNFDDFRRRADAVRGIPLEAVLTFRGALRDPRDRAKWHTERGSLSVTGSKFKPWQQGPGGGGAIDLVMHLAEVNVTTAVRWLEQHLATSHPTVGQPAAFASDTPPTAADGDGELHLPVPQIHLLDRVRRYLTQRRGLSGSLLEPLVQSGKLYADRRGNAVFLLVAGKDSRPVGAELRGTGSRVWRGMAPGTCKNLGFFWIGDPRAQQIVLCESAIDAISYHQLAPERLCVSTSGARANPPWLTALIARRYEIHCGFDADPPGDEAARLMTILHPEVKRLRPPAHDWNDVLVSSR